MFIKQLYTGCLSEAAYYIESNGEAAVIDQIREMRAAKMTYDTIAERLNADKIPQDQVAGTLQASVGC